MLCSMVLLRCQNCPTLFIFVWAMGPPTTATGHCPATSLLLKLTNDDPVSLSPFCWLTKNLATRWPFVCLNIRDFGVIIMLRYKIVESNSIGMFCFEVVLCCVCSLRSENAPSFYCTLTNTWKFLLWIVEMKEINYFIMINECAWRRK